jgi:hypothetical protein
MVKTLVFVASHAFAALTGFIGAVLALPVLTAPPAPDATTISANAAEAAFKGEFRRNLRGSDLLHWGEGIVAVSPRAVSLQGSISPGFNHKLFFSPQFVETRDEFLRFRKDMVPVGDVTTFENFLVEVPPHVDPVDFNSVVIWCERFGRFITAAKYR